MADPTLPPTGPGMIPGFGGSFGGEPEPASTAPSYADDPLAAPGPSLGSFGAEGGGADFLTSSSGTGGSGLGMSSGGESGGGGGGGGWFGGLFGAK